MKRTIGFLSAALLIALLVAACGASPKARADKVVKYLPQEAGDWARDDGETVKLLSSTVTSKGHVTMIYAGPDGAIAYVVVEVHPSEDAAEVASTSRERELRMRGLVFEDDRAPRQATALVAQDGRARYALFQESEYVVEVDALAADEDHLVGDEAFADLLTMVRNAFGKVVE